MKMLERWTHLGRVLAVLSDASPQLVIARASETQGYYVVNSRVRILVKYATTPPDGPWSFEFKPPDKAVLSASIKVEPSFLVLVCADYAIVAADAHDIINLLDPGILLGRQHLRGERARGGCACESPSR